MGRGRGSRDRGTPFSPVPHSSLGRRTQGYFPERRMVIGPRTDTVIIVSLLDNVT